MWHSDPALNFWLPVALYGVPFGVVSIIIALAARPWVGLILTPLAFVAVHSALNLSLDFPATVLPALLLTIALWVFGRVPGIHVLTRRVRIITFAVGVLCLVPFVFLLTGH